MKTYQKESVDSVKNFLYDVYYNCQRKFDPAEDLRTLMDENGILYFSGEEAAYLDNIMLECFLFCVYNKTSIYKIVKEVHINFTGPKAAA